MLIAIAKAVAEWQSKKEQGLLESEKGFEDNIYVTRKLKVCPKLCVAFNNLT